VRATHGEACSRRTRAAAAEDSAGYGMTRGTHGSATMGRGGGSGPAKLDHAGWLAGPRKRRCGELGRGRWAARWLRPAAGLGCSAGRKAGWQWPAALVGWAAGPKG
jgi:hypothetical protein